MTLLLIGCLELKIRIFQIPNVAIIGSQIHTDMGRNLYENITKMVSIFSSSSWEMCSVNVIFLSNLFVVPR